MTSVGVSVMVVMSPSCVAGDTGAGTDGHNNDEASGGAGSYQVTSIRTGRLERLIRYGTSPGPTRPNRTPAGVSLMVGQTSDQHHQHLHCLMETVITRS